MSQNSKFCYLDIVYPDPYMPSFIDIGPAVLQPRVLKMWHRTDDARMLCISAAYAIMLSVCHIYIVETVLPDSHIVLVFRYQTSWQNSEGDPLSWVMGASNAGGVWENHYFRPVSHFITCCQHCNCLGVINMVLPDHGKMVTPIAGSSKRRSL